MSISLFVVSNRIAALSIFFLSFSLSGCGGSSSEPAGTPDGTNSVNFNNQFQNDTQNIDFVARTSRSFLTVNTFDVAALGGAF